MSLALLKPGGLYILLFVRGFPPQKDDFHWALYLHHGTDTGGHKYHIRSPGSAWIADHGPTRGVFKSFLLIGGFRIADVSSGWETHVDQTLRTFDTDINRPGVTCRVWVLWVLELLQQESNGYTVLKCDDLKALERETKDWGNTYASDAADNVQPRPFSDSQICNL